MLLTGPRFGEEGVLFPHHNDDDDDDDAIPHWREGYLSLAKPKRCMRQAGHGRRQAPCTGIASRERKLEVVLRETADDGGVLLIDDR